MRWILLSFDKQNRLLLSQDNKGHYMPSFLDNCNKKCSITEFLSTTFGDSVQLHKLSEVTYKQEKISVYCICVKEHHADSCYKCLDELLIDSKKGDCVIAPLLKKVLASIEPELVGIPYLGQGDNEYIYSFRTAKQRNRSVYIDTQSKALYQSELCSLIKDLRRIKEKKPGEPEVLDFGPIRYIIPSHFGFCLGVQNAIERGYEAIASNPGRRVFMLSELIHNPFVNEDLLARGLRYLQTDKGIPLCGNGQQACGPEDPSALWNQLTTEDIVVIPAFGATNEDKERLIRRGISIREHDATCMLVEKVWKASKRYAREGFTVLIHGKSEHEETKATFSNSSRYGPALILRNHAHAEALAAVIQADGKAKTELFSASFEGLYSKGFDPHFDLEKIAVVNQTTLLRNETLTIIEYLRKIIGEKYGNDNIPQHIWSTGKGDTLCYATQVNQDALQLACAEKIDTAVIVGGRNSSNTYQLYRVCAERFGKNAHYIQSERNIHSMDTICHYIFPDVSRNRPIEQDVLRPFLSNTSEPINLLLSGGASCPDGLIQQVIERVNSFFPVSKLRPLEALLDDLKSRV